MTVWCYLFVLCKKMPCTLFYCRSDFEERYICLLRSRGNFGMDHCSNNIMSKFPRTCTRRHACFVDIDSICLLLKRIVLVLVA